MLLPGKFEHKLGAYLKYLMTRMSFFMEAEVGTETSLHNSLLAHAISGLS